MRSGKGIADRAGSRRYGWCQHGPGRGVFADVAHGCSEEGGGLWLSTDQRNDGFGRSGFGFSLIGERVDERLGGLSGSKEGTCG